jgi:hypothetical protein
MISLQRDRDWQLDFGPVSGPAGSVTTLTVAPQCSFRGEKVMARDTGSTPGRGTRVMSILVGNRPQRPLANGSTLADFFSPVALGNGVRWDTCDKALSISITVSFAEACTFDLTVFGRAAF